MTGSIKYNLDLQVNQPTMNKANNNRIMILYSNPKLILQIHSTFSKINNASPSLQTRHWECRTGIQNPILYRTID